ncbi:MAG: beta-galactosidase, partial [Clostridia bacterium]
MQLLHNWKVMQDVHDLGEKLEIYRDGFEFDNCAHLISAWEPIDRLTALQVVFSKTPYYGRELRYFNQAPWWYCCTFDADSADSSLMRFESVDYYCKVWLNGAFIGEHEGYFDAFEFDVTAAMKQGQNKLVVKVWAPWDKEVLANADAVRCYSVKREMVKGLYEHADGFIQRDVNPVGICGDVSLRSFTKAGFYSAWNACAEISDDLSSGEIAVSASVAGHGNNLRMVCNICDDFGRKLSSYEAAIMPNSQDIGFTV